ncbi:MAG TPA: Rieske (2Fe-2S) protein [Gaiellaceae bacterium]|jgi:nitrite reductase/ring-hydroxylating ferredoxin subunit
MSAWHEVGRLADLERDGRTVARIDGREIGVVRDAATGDLYALRNRCPHSGAPLCFGSVSTRASGDPGSYDLDGLTVIRCPWHGWEYDLESGRCPDDPGMRVAVYPVRVEDGRVLVQA